MTTEPINADELKPLKEHTDEALIEELESRDFHVYDYDMEDQECDECTAYAMEASEKENDLTRKIEKIHYLLAANKNDEAIMEMRKFISDETGYVS